MLCIEQFYCYQKLEVLNCRIKKILALLISIMQVNENNNKNNKYVHLLIIKLTSDIRQSGIT